MIGRITLIALGLGSLAWMAATTAPASPPPALSTALPASADAVLDTGLVFRRVWAGDEPDFYASTPSADGRYLTEIDWERGELVVRDLLTGEFEYVSNVGDWETDWSFPESSVFSPDGRQLAATWYQKGPEHYQIRIFQRDGSGSRLLLDASPIHQYSFIEDWSDDGTLLLATLFGDINAPRGMARLVTIDVATAKVTSLRETTNASVPHLATFSPDGRFVAYDWLVLEPGKANRDIFVMRSDGSGNAAVVTGPANDGLMGWSPDGSSLLFTSDRQLTQGIWQLPVRDGRPVGEPVLLRGDVWGIHPLGFARNAYFYGIHTETPHLRTVALDVANARQLTSITRVTEPTGRESVGGIWSADGSKFAYVEHVSGDVFPQLVVRSVTGEDARRFALEYDVAPVPQPTAWSPDGNSILFWGAGLDGGRGYFRIDLRTGVTSEYAREPAWAVRNPNRAQWSPDWSTLYYARATQNGGTGTILAVDIRTGQSRVIVSEPSDYRARRVSPDGRRLAFAERTHPDSIFIKVVDVGGGSVTTVTGPEPHLRNQTGLAWSSDGKYLLYARNLPGEQDAELVRVPVAGGDPTVIMRTPMRIGLNVSPDGRWISFQSGEWKGEVWMIEGIPGTRAIARRNER